MQMRKWEREEQRWEHLGVLFIGSTVTLGVCSPWNPFPVFLVTFLTLVPTAPCLPVTPTPHPPPVLGILCR